MSPEELGEMVDKMALQLGEHFDAVQIMATLCDKDGTRSYYRGAGNWFARQGLAHEFITSEIAESTAKSIAKELN